MLTREEMQGSWNQIVGAIQKKYADITGDEISRFKGNAEELVGHLQRKTGQTREEIEAFIGRAAGTASSALNRVASVAGDYAAEGKQRVQESYDYVSDLAEEGVKNARTTVKQNPVESVGVAFLVGIAAGFFIGCSMFNRSR